MRGLHLTADLYQCRCEPRWLNDATQLGPWCRQAAEAVGLPVGHDLVRPSADGLDAALLLTGSHVCLHTHAGERSASIDVYLSHGDGDLSAKARGLMFALVQRFQPEWTEQRSLDRGEGDE
ncbi:MULTISPECIES: S-adenosylmethionine decarboxylase [Ramlibacter]|uniref:S-adenosylmethionine decarboxylase proenzyme n=1 Tax=Ramlibacter pinisoli TaxID=2682844 RepID=A0A6N8J1V8_9BURK|nr:MULTISPECIES: S-adenosylmethionine decarboxylase [Ramlibacter]MBA2962872.1 S-adenosylmethionine decarboxylase [Ramlibacter sp. CGMCC 1.13660]MVQ32815.1 S-adenosylmethionine decarboxylase proenzyme [Ramlibacter pinisoli]